MNAPMVSGCEWSAGFFFFSKTLQLSICRMLKILVNTNTLSMRNSYEACFVNKVLRLQKWSHIQHNAIPDVLT